MLTLFLFNLLFFTIVPMFSIERSVRNMCSGHHRAIRCPEIEQKMKAEVLHQNFLQTNNFYFDDSFRYHNIEAGFWTQENILSVTRQYVCMTSPTSPSVQIFEFVTSFGEYRSLTTTASSSAFLFPRPPGACIQSLDTNNVEDLWKYHLDGEEFLLQEFGLRVAQDTRIDDIEYHLNSWLQRQGNYIRKIPFFWLRAPYWFYIRRFRMRGVSIGKQLSKR